MQAKRGCQKGGFGKPSRSTAQETWYQIAAGWRQGCNFEKDVCTDVPDGQYNHDDREDFPNACSEHLTGCCSPGWRAWKYMLLNAAARARHRPECLLLERRIMYSTEQGGRYCLAGWQDVHKHVPDWNLVPKQPFSQPATRQWACQGLERLL